MKKISFIFALIAIFMMSGCNSDTKTIIEGEPLVISEQVEGVCDEANVLKVKTVDQEALLSVDDVNYTGEWGMNATFTVVTPCPEPEECNVTTPVECEECPEPVICGEGTDEINGTCEILVVEDPIVEPIFPPDSPVQPEEPTLTCDDDFVLVDEMCLPKTYTPARVDGDYVDCIEQYTWGPVREVCKIIRNLTL